MNLQDYFIYNIYETAWKIKPKTASAEQAMELSNHSGCGPSEQCGLFADGGYVYSTRHYSLIWESLALFIGGKTVFKRKFTAFCTPVIIIFYKTPPMTSSGMTYSLRNFIACMPKISRQGFCDLWGLHRLPTYIHTLRNSIFQDENDIHDIHQHRHFRLLLRSES